MENIFEQFKAIDQFRAEFKELFLKQIVNTLLPFFPFLKIDEPLEEAINTYATHILNATESVIDKDKNYPDYRLKEELERIQNIANKPVMSHHNPELIQALNKQVKMLIVEHFSKVFNLSGDGFRILENNALMYNRHFVNDFYIIQKNYEAE
jgi:hypothetical protein